MDHPIITLSNIHFAYPGRKPVMQGLDFNLRAQEKIGLVGPNGSGKTTLFHIAMGLLTPSQGSVSFQGKKLADKKDFVALRRNVGLTFQNSDDQLFCPTVLEDIAFGPLNLGESPDDAREIAHDVLEFLGLEGYADRTTYNLSGGEKRLVALGTVLAMRPQALLLDEPTNDLDPATRSRLIHILEHLDLARVIISHDMDFVARTTDCLQAIQDGRVTRDPSATAHSHVHVHEKGDLPHEHGNEK